MKARTRAAFTLVELLTVIAIIGLLISILLPSLGRAREMAHRTGCLANQAIIMKGILVYAKDSDGKLPNWGQVMPGFANVGHGWDWNGDPTVTTGAYSAGPYYNAATATGNDAVRSNTRNYYILIRKGLADPKNFQCYSDSEGGQPFLPADPSIAFDLQHRAQNSFSFQYQNPAANSSLTEPLSGWATSIGDDPKVVIIADKSPLFRAISAVPSPYDATIGYFYDVPAVRATDSFFLAMLRCESQASVNTSTGAYVPGLTQDEIMALNSQNHKGEGQNIARLDGSGAFAQNPWQGVGSDNIWTVQDSANIEPQPAGTVTSLASLRARVAGAFPDSTFQNASTESLMLQQWMRKPLYNKNKYADSFLVP